MKAEFRSPEELHQDRKIRMLLEATAGKTGHAFFRSLAKSMTEVLETSAAWITRYSPEDHRLMSLAMYADGAFVEDYEYDVAGTPCEPVVESCKIAHFEKNLIELFPHDPDLAPLNAVSYIGAPFTDAQGNLLGHVAAINDKPMPFSQGLFEIIDLFAVRANAEYQRMRAEAETREREQQLSQLLDSAMDAILILDPSLTIRRINPAATRLFECEEEDLLGENFKDFLSNSSGLKLENLIRKTSANENQFWIPEGLEVMRWDRRMFPGEATLSRFQSAGNVLFTLILRNVDERIAARRKIEELSQETHYVKAALEQAIGQKQIIGESRVMKELSVKIERVAQTDATVLILGQTGTGKELVASNIHRKSMRRNRPFVCVNCGAIPETLMESEFFGHEKGSFTGATTRRKGYFESAHGGSLFLDEIGELPLSLQVKLLRILQEGTLQRLGGADTITIDVRVIAATHRKLETMVREGTFREDLYYRLNVFPLTVPQLKERGKDVLLLADTFIDHYHKKMGRITSGLSEEDKATLLAYAWPGNVRELQNVIERALIQSTGGRLSIRSAMPQAAEEAGTSRPEVPTQEVMTVAQLKALEKRNIERALQLSNGAVFGDQGAAIKLGMKPTTLASRIKKLGIEKNAGS